MWQQDGPSRIGVSACSHCDWVPLQRPHRTGQVAPSRAHRSPARLAKKAGPVADRQALASEALGCDRNPLNSKELAFCFDAEPMIRARLKGVEPVVA